MPKAEREWERGHRPFEVLKDLVDGGKLELAPETDKLVAPPKLSPELSDEEAFQAGMAEVTALGWSERPLSLPIPFEIAGTADGEKAALSELSAFVEGRGEMDPFQTGEGIEGASSRRGRRFLPRLRRGEFSVQDHLDLHGLDRDEAREALHRFLRQSRHKSYTCVRVIHGRGIHSDTEPSLMKREITRWLSSRRLSRVVVAFASARWKDGGSGAVYVLLYD